jgi:DNA recombination protein RmuC
VTFEVSAILALAAVLVCGMAVGLVLLVRRQPRDERSTVTDPILELKTLLAGRDGVLDEKVAQLDTKLAGLQESITSREAVLNTQVTDMGTQMRTITGLFSNDRARGNWGEISMVRIFESGGLVEGRDFETQVTINGRTPDALIHLPGGCDVVVDAKFPIARYVEALEVDNSEEQARLLKLQGRELESVGRELARKHYGEFASGSYVIMYLPSQAVYESAVAAHPEVLESLMAEQVIVAGPNALFAVLMNVGALMKEHRAIQQADEILTQAKELHSRMNTFIGHLEKVGRSLGTTVNSFNALVGSWTGNVAPQLNRIGEMRGETFDAQILPIDEAVRDIPLASRDLKVINQ